nr:hypothetical protein [uncultured Methanolobus sp.]
MEWKLSRRTHQRFRHFRVWKEMDSSEESCKSKIPAMTSEKELFGTWTSEPLYLDKPDKSTWKKMRKTVQLPIH